MLIESLFEERVHESSAPRVSSVRTLQVPRKLGGVRVTHDTALTYGAVYACVRIISETIGCLPWDLLRRSLNGDTERIKDAQLSRVLHDRANDETLACTMRETLLAWALTWGNGFAEIDRDGAGRVGAMHQIEPDRIRPDRDGQGQLIYEVINGSGASNTILDASRVFHLKGLGWNGITGYSVISMAQRSIAIGIASDTHAASFWGNKAIPFGILEHPGHLEDEGVKNLRESWKEMHSGPQKAGEIGVLEEGLKFHAVTVSGKDSQFLDSRKFQVAEIARWFRIPPHKLADLEKATFSNIEEQNIDFVTDSILPWTVRLEQEANAKLLGRQQRSNMFTRLNVTALLRGNQEKRFEAYKVGREWGWLSANDVRRLEDLNNIGPQGDVYLVPLNHVDAKTLLEKPKPAPSAIALPEDESESGQDIEAARRYSQRQFMEVITRLMKREAKAGRRLTQKFLHSHRTLAASDFATVMIGCAREILPEALSPSQLRQIEMLACTYAGEYVTRTASELRDGRHAFDLIRARNVACELFERTVEVALAWMPQQRRA